MLHGCSKLKYREPVNEHLLTAWLHGQRGSQLIHTKIIIVDFTSDAPVVISGSHNLSKVASEGNDENYLILRGNTDVADCYGCELMRIYDHYRFRSFVKQTPDSKPPVLQRDDSWTDPYFTKVHSKKAPACASLE